MSRRTLLAVVCAASALAASPGHAKECKGTTQGDLNECARVDYQRADRSLNESYDRLIKKISPAAQGKLKEAQRAWILYRDKSCELEASVTEGGSMQPMVRSGCLEGLTAQRTKMLRGYLNCEEGDTACVGNL